VIIRFESKCHNCEVLESLLHSSKTENARLLEIILSNVQSQPVQPATPAETVNLDEYKSQSKYMNWAAKRQELETRDRLLAQEVNKDEELRKEIQRKEKELGIDNASGVG
jgi:hypothetical protein